MSFAAADTCPHSRSGKEYLPLCMLLNRLVWQSPQEPVKGGYPHRRMYTITPKDHMSHFLSYLRSSSVSSIKASTNSGAMNSALPTGVTSIGVVIGPDNPDVNLIPEPSSKSHSLTGQMVSSYKHRMFAGFRARGAS